MQAALGEQRAAELAERRPPGLEHGAAGALDDRLQVGVGEGAGGGEFTDSQVGHGQSLDGRRHAWGVGGRM